MSDGYYGHPIVKPPVWTWEVPVYFFAGGVGGMSGVLAFAALVTGAAPALVRTALAVAATSALVCPILLVLDLGRPLRFLHMLRVLKWGSPMSVGAWILAAFGATAVPAWLAASLLTGPSRSVAVGMLTGATALFGSLLATYTGVLIGATVIPVWNAHHRLLPLHFGVAALGSAAAALELLGFRTGALHAIGIAAATIETALGAFLELGRRRADRALRQGPAGWLVRVGGALTGPLPLVVRLFGGRAIAAAAFLLGALLVRFGWVAAGRASALDPGAILARDGFEDRRALFPDRTDSAKVMMERTGESPEGGSR